MSDLKTVNPLSRDFVQAGRELQIPHNGDFNSAEQEGLGMYQVTQKDGRRWSSAQAFLRGAEARSNLEIFTDARVTRVVMEEKTATGVTLQQSGEYRQLRLNAGGEVILSGGP